MPKRTSPPAGNYVVGYRRPPKATQFKKGISGNPKGRRKGSRPIGAVLQEIIHQKVAVTENGKTRHLPALEVMLRKLRNDAMRGDQRAVKLLLSLLENYGLSNQTTLQLGEMLAEDTEILAQYLGDSIAAEGPQPAAEKDNHNDGSNSAS